MGSLERTMVLGVLPQAMHGLMQFLTIETAPVTVTTDASVTEEAYPV